MGPSSRATATARRAGPCSTAWRRGSRSCWRSTSREPGWSASRWTTRAWSFLAPPSWEELVRRLTGRGTEAPEVIERRLAAAKVELAAEAEFDTTLVNTSVEDVARELLALMLQA